MAQDKELNEKTLLEMIIGLREQRDQLAYKPTHITLTEKNRIFPMVMTLEEWKNLRDNKFGLGSCFSEDELGEMILDAWEDIDRKIESIRQALWEKDNR